MVVAKVAHICLAARACRVGMDFFVCHLPLAWLLLPVTSFA